MAQKSITSELQLEQTVTPAPLGQEPSNELFYEPRSEAGCYVSEERYWQDYYEGGDFNYEWNNGILEEKPMADVQNAELYRWFLMLLEFFLHVHPIARLVNLEIGFRLKLTNKTTIRKPDLFVVRNDNPVPLHDDDHSFRGIGDLCIESLSDTRPGEIERDTVVKKGEYAGVGVKEYFILDALGRHTAFYRRTTSGAYEPIRPADGEIIRSEVLPGFQFRIADLYRLPSWIALAEDPVYRHFVLLEYQAIQALAEQERQRAEQEQQRAEQERQRAEQERQQAEQERQRADRLAARLRALGLDEDQP